MADLRWLRRDIKSVSLLPNVLAKQQAIEAGAYEAWLVEADGRVTEATASNAWIVRGDGVIVTHPADHSILNGITRGAVLSLARELGLTVAEHPFTLAEAKCAREAFVTGTTSWVKPVIRIDDATIGDGCMGMVTEQLLRAYVEHVNRQALGKAPA
jgi:D-alanine transaminase